MLCYPTQYCEATRTRSSLHFYRYTYTELLTLYFQVHVHGAPYTSTYRYTYTELVVKAITAEAERLISATASSACASATAGTFRPPTRQESRPIPNAMSLI